MNAYLIPVLAALLAAAGALAILGAARLGRWWKEWRRGEPEASWAPGPAIAGDRVDPNVSRLAQRTLGSALFLGLAANLFFAFASEPSGASDLPRAAMAIGLLAVWAASMRAG